MALTATVYRANISVIDVDRNYYADHPLTLPCQPSETAVRMMMRVLSFALNAHADLALAQGMLNNEEPDAWQKDLTGAIQMWVEVGQPDEKRILKACGRSARVRVYAYHSRPEVWWTPLAPRVQRARNLEVFSVDATAAKGLESFVSRSFDIQFTIQDGEVWARNNSSELLIPVTALTI